MSLVLGLVNDRKVQKWLEIFLIVLILMIIFSFAGVPMVLLSTFPPSLNGEDLEQNNEGVTGGLEASAAA